MALGVVEEPDRQPVHDLHGPHDARSAEALGLLQAGLDVVDLDVEGDVALALLPRADSAADPDAVGVGVPIARHEAVVHRVVRVDLPTEHVRVEALKPFPVLPEHLEVHNRLTHLLLLSGRRLAVALHRWLVGSNAAIAIAVHGPTRAGAPSCGGRGPRRGSPPRRPSRARPRAAAGRTRAASLTISVARS